MRDKLIAQLSHELNMQEFISSKEPNHYTLLFDKDVEVDVIKSDERYALKSTIGPCPKQNSESFLLRSIEANLFGIGTRGSVIGLNENGNHLVLSQEVDENSSYNEFKNKLEDFVNMIDFWRSEALNHQ